MEPCEESIAAYKDIYCCNCLLANTQHWWGTPLQYIKTIVKPCYSYAFWSFSYQKQNNFFFLTTLFWNIWAVALFPWSQSIIGKLGWAGNQSRPRQLDCKNKLSRFDGYSFEIDGYSFEITKFRIFLVTKYVCQIFLGTKKVCQKNFG